MDEQVDDIIRYFEFELLAIAVVVDISLIFDSFMMYEVAICSNFVYFVHS